jgi:O-methyltransferase
MDRPHSLIGDAQLLEMMSLALDTPPGPIVEVGVFQGGSAVYLASVAKGTGRSLHLFDTFKGIPCKGPGDHHNVGDFADVSLDAVRLAIPSAIYHVGIFPHTLPDDLQGLSFVHCDADQAQSVEAVIQRLWPRVVPGGIIVFDDSDQIAARKVIEDAFGGQLQDVRGRVYVRK